MLRKVKLMTHNKSMSVLLLAAACLPACSIIQAQEAKTQKTEPDQVQTFFLKNVTGINELNDVQTALRNAVPRAHFYGSQSSRSITGSGSDEDMRATQKVLNDLDRPKKSYRITYTIADMEDGKRGNPQHFLLVVVGNNTTELRQGDRVPIVTGKFGEEKSAEQQFQYIDVGINIVCSAEASALHTKIELSAVADERSNVGIQDPVIRQTRLEGFSLFTPGKPQIIGAIDVPGTSRRQQIEVLVESLP